jgi:hypothetical protein
MSEKPILFSGPMVRAILDGRKTQTRRVIKPQPEICTDLPGKAWYQRNRRKLWCDYTHEQFLELCPYGTVGTNLWVRETWAQAYQYEPNEICLLRDSSSDYAEKCKVALYRATYDGPPNAAFKWRPSIHMPRWACRITLEVTDVRVQRLQEISEKDAIAEGIEPEYVRAYMSAEEMAGADGRDPWDVFADLWDSINAKRGFSWDSNPWVWAITFKRIGERHE